MSARSLAVFGVVIVGTLTVGLGSAGAADLSRHHHLHIGSDIYADDLACPTQEPTFYRPRVANYIEPLCYAARPYGISAHLYDHPRELGGYNSAAGY